jgi:glycosyltransferase involved in cell wall biosynthesis
LSKSAFPISSDREAGILVAQLGARRHYAVPLAFHAHGKLQRLCTDVLVHSPSIQRTLRLASELLGKAELRRLADRQSGVGLPRSRTHSFPLFGLHYKWRAQRARSAQARTANWLWGGERFARLCAGQLDASTSAVYAFTSAALELFQAARDQGIKCWLDHATAPRGFEVGLIQEESRHFPGWSGRPVEDALTDSYLARQRAELALADLIVCGSSFAKRAIEAEGVASERILVVPLGVADHLYADRRLASYEDHRGLRVLYVGGDGLRKGIGYLSQALDMLGRDDFEVRAAGDLDLSRLALAQLSSRMRLLGTVPRSDMPALFRWADVLVLPSISDTFGMVILEAMAAGLVVIASENTAAPDILRHGTDGFVVPIRDPAAISSALQAMASDHDLMRAMGRAARERAGEFTVSRYGERLMAALGLTVPDGFISTSEAQG